MTNEEISAKATKYVEDAIEETNSLGLDSSSEINYMFDIRKSLKKAIEIIDEIHVLE